MPKNRNSINETADALCNLRGFNSQRSRMSVSSGEVDKETEDGGGKFQLGEISLFTVRRALSDGEAKMTERARKHFSFSLQLRENIVGSVKEICIIDEAVSLIKLTERNNISITRAIALCNKDSFLAFAVIFLRACQSHVRTKSRLSRSSTNFALQFLSIFPSSSRLILLLICHFRSCSGSFLFLLLFFFFFSFESKSVDRL